MFFIKEKIFLILQLVMLLVLAICFKAPAVFSNEVITEEQMFFMDIPIVTIASKMEEEAIKAPSIITVITAKEIENIGARTLTGVVPNSRQIYCIS